MTGNWPGKETGLNVPNEKEQHMQNHEGPHGTFLELKVITQVYKLFIHNMSGEREAAAEI